MLKYLSINVLLVVLFVGACAPVKREPFVAGKEYSRANQETQQIKDIPEKWWEIFADNELNALIQLALQNNPDINQTKKRLEAAAALARKTMSDLLPSATIAGERENSKTDSSHTKELSLSGAASYELDLFGKNRASYKKEDLSAQASLEDLRVSAITISASVTENWLRLRALRKEASLLSSQVETNQTILKLQQGRYESGVATALDVLQQKEVLARAKALLPDVKANKELVAHQLLILVGKDPSSNNLSLKGDTIPDILPLPDAGIPSKLLEQRPDVTAAWLRLQSSDWAAASAVRNRLPSFTLSASYATSGATVDALFNTWLLNMAAGVALPVLDGGNRRAEALRQKALADEKFHAYRQVTLNAIKEVEDALTRNHYQEQKVAAVKDQLDASRDSLEQAQVSYSSGDASYINVLNGLLNVQSLERQLVQARRDLALFRVELYRSLGLSKWTDEVVNG